MTATKPRKLPSTSHSSKIGHADYRLWIEKYGWEPDPDTKRRQQNNKNNRKRRWHDKLKKGGRVTPGRIKLYPALGKRAGRLCASAMKRAAFLHIPCDIDGRWVLEKLIAGHCEATGIPFDIAGEETGDQHRSMFAPSLDQIRPRGGYTKDNVQVVVWCYNAAKGEGTDADVLRMAEALVAKSRQGKYEG